MLSPHPSPSHPPRKLLWTYEVKGVKFNAKSFKELVDLVRLHEAHKLLTMQETEQAVLAYVKEEQPWLVKGQSEELSETPQEIFRKYIDGLLPEYVDSEIYADRAAICLRCKFNVMPELDDESMRAVYLLGKGKSVFTFGLCSIHRHHNAIACWMVKNASRHPDAPAQCWVDKQS